MNGLGKFVCVAAVAGATLLFPAKHVLAEEVAPDADVVGSASSPSRKAPIKVDVVDYQRAEDGPGTLKLGGKAIPGLDLHIFVDNQRFALVKMPEDKNEWTTEDEIKLDDSVHEIRIQQFDSKTQMPAATAMFRIKLSPPTPQDLAAPPPRQE